MNILYINFAESPEDKKAWSGTVYKVYKSLLNTGAEIDYFCCQPKSTLLYKSKAKLAYYINRILSGDKKLRWVIHL